MSKRERAVEAAVIERLDPLLTEEGFVFDKREKEFRRQREGHTHTLRYMLLGKGGQPGWDLILFLRVAKPSLIPLLSYCAPPALGGDSAGYTVADRIENVAPNRKAPRAGATPAETERCFAGIQRVIEKYCLPFFERFSDDGAVLEQALAHLGWARAPHCSLPPYQTAMALLGDAGKGAEINELLPDLATTRDIEFARRLAEFAPDLGLDVALLPASDDKPDQPASDAAIAEKTARRKGAKKKRR